MTACVVFTGGVLCYRYATSISMVKLFRRATILDFIFFLDFASQVTTRQETEIDQI